MAKSSKKKSSGKKRAVKKSPKKAPAKKRAAKPASRSRKSSPKKNVSRKGAKKRPAKKAVRRKAVKKKVVKKKAVKAKPAKKKKPAAKKAPARRAKPAKKVPVLIVAGSKKASGNRRGISFSDGLEYPFGRAKRLWNILWVLVPIVGPFALFGYESKIVQAIVGGNKKELPSFGSFGENLKIGFFLALKALPLFAIVWLVKMLPVIGKPLYVLSTLLLVPYLLINLLYTTRIDAVFEIDKAGKAVFMHFGEYVEVMFKTVIFLLVYGILSFILIGIPCMEFGQYIFMGDFYSRHR